MDYENTSISTTLPTSPPPAYDKIQQPSENPYFCSTSHYDKDFTKKYYSKYEKDYTKYDGISSQYDKNYTKYDKDCTKYDGISSQYGQRSNQYERNSSYHRATSTLNHSSNIYPNISGRKFYDDVRNYKY